MFPQAVKVVKVKLDFHINVKELVAKFQRKGHQLTIWRLNLADQIIRLVRLVIGLPS